MLMRGQIPVQENTEVQRADPAPRTDTTKYRTSREDYPGSDAQHEAASQRQGENHPTAPIVVGKKVGRNDPCPCGSGKKYKNCHGKGLV
jgi:preprotein translocase subunit SecA